MINYAEFFTKTKVNPPAGFTRHWLADVAGENLARNYVIADRRGGLLKPKRESMSLGGEFDTFRVDLPVADAYDAYDVSLSLIV